MNHAYAYGSTAALEHFGLKTADGHYLTEEEQLYRKVDLEKVAISANFVAKRLAHITQAMEKAPSFAREALSDRLGRTAERAGHMLSNRVDIAKRVIAPPRVAAAASNPKNMDRVMAAERMISSGNALKQGRNDLRAAVSGQPTYLAPGVITKTADDPCTT